MPHRTIYSGIKAVLHYWYSSLNLLEPKEVSLLALSAANNMLRSVPALIKNFSWWLFVWAGFVEWRVDGSGLFCRLAEYRTPLLQGVGANASIYTVTSGLCVFVLIALVRSSLQQKTLSYYVRMSGRLIFFLPLFVLLPHAYMLPALWLAAFFLCDAPFGIRAALLSLYNGAVLSFLYAPFLLCLGALHGLLFNLHAFVWELFSIERHMAVFYAAKYATSVVLYLFFLAMLYAFYARVVQGRALTIPLRFIK